MSDQHVLVTFPPSPGVREALSETLGPLADLAYLAEVGPTARIAALASADVVLAWSLASELEGAEEYRALGSARLLQLLSAGVDQVPFSQLPDGLPVASNAASYAGPMAEHVLAMTLELAKRLRERHADLQAGIFDQDTVNRDIRGSVVCILGYGGIGRASALLFRAFGARIHAISRSATADDWLEKVSTLDDLDDELAEADVVVVCLPLTRTTRGLIGKRELSLMRPDAILVNVARGAIIEEEALYEHLVAHPTFLAGIDTWWEEPRGNLPFLPRLPFLDLPNVLGSPHNSAITEGSLVGSATQAAANIARALRGEPVQHLVDRTEYDD